MLAVIGGSGLDTLPGLNCESEHSPVTPYGRASAAVQEGLFHGCRILFLPRHAPDHRIAPHLINYRANIWALQQAGAKAVLAMAAVGGISPHCRPLQWVVPDQLIDYTWGREHTFVAGDAAVHHILFTQPYSEPLRQQLLAVAKPLKLSMVERGVYGVTQGPRLETAAEIRRLQADGCDIVGMTGMPEAALARECGLDYATLAWVVNWAAGIAEEEISLKQIDQYLHLGQTELVSLLRYFCIEV